MPKGRSKRTSLIASITNRPTGGGSKKEGLAPSVGTGNLSIWKGMGRSYGTPEDRNKLFCINQLGSVIQEFIKLGRLQMELDHAQKREIESQKI